eukprot:5700898-Alexandrium_andersonii.AAC.1
MAAGNRRSVRRTNAGDGRAWVSTMATNALGWERDLTEDGDVESQPGPHGHGVGSGGEAVTVHVWGSLAPGARHRSLGDD